jgi:hypothetical protein
MIDHHANLHWEFFTWGKANVAFQRHVIMGFSTEDPKFPHEHRNRPPCRDLRAPDHREPRIDPQLRDAQRSRYYDRRRRRRCETPQPRGRDRRVLALAAGGRAEGLKAGAHVTPKGRGVASLVDVGRCLGGHLSDSQRASVTECSHLSGISRWCDDSADVDKADGWDRMVLTTRPGWQVPTTTVPLNSAGFE